jgi:hypothetical protein
MATSQEPNLYVVHGQDVQVTFSTTSFNGKPQLTYHDATQARQFTGDEITIEDTAIGQLVTVVLSLTVDLGSTTFSLVVPAVRLSGTGPQPISTLGITAVHRTTIAGPPTGQATTYRVVRLRGTAERVDF